MNLEPFRLPNYVRFSHGLVAMTNRGERPTISVGELSDEQALAYWDWMKTKWLEHVRERRKEKP